MTYPALNPTHDPARRSWVSAANAADAEFPIQNLPFAAFRVGAQGQPVRCGVGIGDQILDVSQCVGLLGTQGARAAAQACAEPTLNALMALGPAAASELRSALSDLLSADQPAHREAVQRALRPLSDVTLVMPVRVGGFTDFFASVHHATNVGKLFRPDNPLLPNYKYVPIAYNGRANSVRVSGEDVRRPSGQIKPPGDAPPVFAPSRRLDYEVELGCYIGEPSLRDAPAAVAQAWKHIFGFSLLNDWSARDIQSWEYQPLGPFLAKSFATTVSPWVITAEALAPFRIPAAPRPAGDPAPLPYLTAAADQQAGGIDVVIDASLRTQRMAALGLPGMRLSRSTTGMLYWTYGQMVAHYTSNGSALDTGDLLGSGTVSGSDDQALGSMIEIGRGGQRPLRIEATGEERSFLEDGDEVSFTGRCQRDGFITIGFGSCAARIVPAAPNPTRE